MLFKDRAVHYIFIVSLLVCILFPLINIYFIYPSFTKLLVTNTENEAIRLGTHLSEMFSEEDGTLLKNKIHNMTKKKVHKMVNDFNLMKLKIFSPSGDTLYSTSEKDIGKINTKDYFHNVVAKGRPFTKVVRKNNRSLEGQVVTTDVVETYVPIMTGNTFVGAFEIYYDITERNHALSKIMHWYGAIPFVLMMIYFVVITIMLVKHDKSIIHKHQAEMKLKGLNSQLQSEIVERNRAEQELIAFAEKLEHSNRELESFAHIASHDLQEPLRKVTAFGDRLFSRYADKLDDRGRDYLQRMQNASRRMQKLINGLLNFSRVTTKAQPFSPVDLNEMVSGVVADLEVRVEQSGGQIDVSELTTLDADPLQMRQLMQNLIGNALKFSRENEPPFVKVHGEVIQGTNDSDGGTYRLIVEDNGIGFDEKYTDRIFGVFQRLHGRKEYEGTGIGLSICRRIVERHEGKITARSRPGEGASFIVTLPIKQTDGGKDGE